MKILVSLKRVADPDNANKVKVSPDGQRVTSDGLEWKLNPFDEYAVEAALRINENGASGEKLGEVVVVSLGPDDVQTTLRQPLAMGADRGIQVKETDDQLDSSVVAKALKALVDAEKPDLVLMGKQAVDGDSNTAGQILAELLGWPMATFAMAIEVEASVGCGGNANTSSMSCIGYCGDCATRLRTSPSIENTTSSGRQSTA